MLSHHSALNIRQTQSYKIIMNIDSAIYANKEGSLISVVVGGDAYYVPDVIGNRHRRLLSSWEAEGNTIQPYIQELKGLRAEKIADIKAEGLKRIQSKVDAIDSIAMAKLIYKHMWPQANASQALLDGEAIYNYAATKISQATGATRAQLEGYDPTTDTGWPQ